MFQNFRYILFLLAFIVASFGYVQATSDVRTVTVTGKVSGDGGTRRGITATRYAVTTREHGELPLLKMPVIGYAFGAEDAWHTIPQGRAVQVRVGHWPPSFLGTSRHYIMKVY